MNAVRFACRLSTVVIVVLLLPLAAAAAAVSHHDDPLASSSFSSSSSSFLPSRYGDSMVPLPNTANINNTHHYQHQHPHQQQQGESGMKKRSICSHGSCQWFFQSKAQTSFRVLPDRTISSFKPPRASFPDTALFEMTAVRSALFWCLPHNAKPVTIVAVLTNSYVCMKSNGKVYASAVRHERDCTFCEEHRADLHFIYYRALDGREMATTSHSDVLYLGVNSRCGKMMDGKRGRACAQVTANQQTPHFCADILFVKVPPGDDNQRQSSMTSSSPSSTSAAILGTHKRHPRPLATATTAKPAPRAMGGAFSSQSRSLPADIPAFSPSPSSLLPTTQQSRDTSLTLVDARQSDVTDVVAADPVRQASKGRRRGKGKRKGRGKGKKGRSGKDRCKKERRRKEDSKSRSVVVAKSDVRRQQPTGASAAASLNSDSDNKDGNKQQQQQQNEEEKQRRRRRRKRRRERCKSDEEAILGKPCIDSRRSKTNEKMPVIN